MVHVFLVIYLLEIAVRFWAVGLRCLKDPWVGIVCVLVAGGVFLSWVISPIVGDVEEVRAFMPLRIMRLLRLARTMRLNALSGALDAGARCVSRAA